MKVVTYNCCSALKAGRLLQIVREINADILFLTGLRIRAVHSRAFETFSIDKYFAVLWGWARAPLSNCSAGVAIVLGKRFNGGRVTRIFSPEPWLQGRAGGIRVQAASYDLTCSVVYPPPLSDLAGKRKAQVTAAKEVVKFVKKVFVAAPGRSARLLGGDLNTQMGFDMDGAPWEAGVGEHNTGVGSEWSDCLLDLLVCEELDVVTTFWKRAGPTFVGPTGHTSCIDTVVADHALRLKAKACFVDWGLARALQLIPSRAARDHLPVVVMFDYQLLFHTPGATVDWKWDYDRLGECLQRGTGRVEFLEKLEVAFVAAEEKMVECYEDRAPDMHWQIFVDTLTEVGQDFFGKNNGRKVDEEVEELRERRLELLKLLRANRFGVSLMAPMESGFEWNEAQWELHYTQKSLKRNSASLARRRQEVLVVELQEAMRAGQKANIQRLARLIAQTKIGIRKRVLGRLSSMLPSVAELKQSAEAEPCAGGLGAVQVNFEEEIVGLIADYPELEQRDLNIEMEASADLKRTLLAMGKSSKRRASPRWSVPLEIFLMALAPSYCSVSLPKAEGLGCSKLGEVADRAGSCKGALWEILVHVRRASATPNVANLSKGFFIDKENGKAWLLGQRLLHIYCPFWRSFFGGIVKEAEKKKPFEWADFSHAYLAGRRREGAMLAQRATSWTLRRLKISHINDLRDMTNAFASTTKERREETLATLIPEKHQALFTQRITNSAVELVSFEEEAICMVPQLGNIIGSSEGPLFFLGEFPEGYDQVAGAMFR